METFDGVRWANGCEAGELAVEKGKDNQERALLGHAPPYAHLAPVYRILPSLAPPHSQQQRPWPPSNLA